MDPQSMEQDRPDPSLENLSEAFGFPVPPTMPGLVRAARRLRPDEPSRALEPLGVLLGGPLYPFLGGVPVSLRGIETPPELFPFAFEAAQVHSGLVVDNPLDASAERPLARLDPHGALGCTILASTLPDWLAGLGGSALQAVPTGVKPRDHRKRIDSLMATLAGEVPLAWPADPEAIARKALRDREAGLTYRTDDLLGVVVPEEPAPLELIAVESRRFLIGRRDRNQVHEAGRRALRLAAPGAALALGRDLLWQLGNRPEWHRVALELLEEAYHNLKRPLLARVVSREWARFHQHGGG